MTIQPRATSGANSATCSKPTGTLEGDFMVALVSDPAASPISGWTEIQAFRGSAPKLAVFVRTAGASEPSSYAFGSGSGFSSSAIHSYYDDGGAALNVDISGIQNNASSTSITAPSVTTTKINTKLIWGGTTNAAALIDQPAGMTLHQRLQTGSNYPLTTSDESFVGPGSTGTRVGSCATAAGNQASLIALATTNVAPDVPTNLQRISVATDTTPAFSADISDPDSGQQIKAKFEIYQSDGTTFVGSVESAFRAGDGSVSAEYSTALAVGSYKVQARTIDDAGATSGPTAQISFDITQLVTKDLILLWDVIALITKDLVLLWDVFQNNQKDLVLIWNVFTGLSKDLTLKWDYYPIWEDVPYETGTPIWEEVSP